MTGAWAGRDMSDSAMTCGSAPSLVITPFLSGTGHPGMAGRDMILTSWEREVTKREKCLGNNK